MSLALEPVALAITVSLPVASPLAVGVASAGEEVIGTACLRGYLDTHVADGVACSGTYRHGAKAGEDMLKRQGVLCLVSRR